MNIFQSLILGIVEGITEFLPISSTAHLILASRLLGLGQTDYLKSFEVTIQLGAILAVVSLYLKRLWTDWNTNLRIAVAFLPAGVLGFFLYRFIRGVLFENVLITLAALVGGGILLIAFEKWHHGKEGGEANLAVMPLRKAFLIGVFQSLAVVPGVSRAAATIAGGLVAGLSRHATVELSFLLAIPTMAAATAFDLYKNAGAFSLDEFQLLVAGFVTAFAAARFSISFLLHYISHHTFIPFGIYRILAAAAFWLLFY